MSKKAGKIVHLSFQIALFVLATVCFGIYVYCASDFLSVSAMNEAEGGMTGLTVGASLIVMLIFAIAGGVPMAISLILSASVIPRRDRKYKIYGIIATVVNLLYILLTAGSCALLIYLHNTGAI